ncbi:MAG: deoxyribodipyrimidine photo-lyase, partial [Myxococcota bacterium]
MSRTVVVWFRNDLRVSDHACLYEASRRADRVLPIYCFDPRHFALTALGFPKTGSYRAAFLLESVADLRRSLRARGSDLIVRVGRPEVEVARLAATHQAEAVLFHHEPFPE